MNIKKGDILNLNESNTKVLVISNDKRNKYSEWIYGLYTKSDTISQIPTSVLYNVQLINKSDLKEKVGEVTKQTLIEIDKKLKTEANELNNKPYLCFTI